MYHETETNAEKMFLLNLLQKTYFVNLYSS